MRTGDKQFGTREHEEHENPGQFSDQQPGRERDRTRTREQRAERTAAAGDTRTPLMAIHDAIHGDRTNRRRRNVCHLGWELVETDSRG